MDFDVKNSIKIENFRKSVKVWIDENAHGSSPYLFASLLAQKGWLVPSWEWRHGGANLTLEHADVIKNELDEIGFINPHENNVRIASAIYEWGTGLQREQICPELLRSSKDIYRWIFEGEIVADPSIVDIQGRKDGDGYILSGRGFFIASSDSVKFIWVLAVTEVNTPSHRSLTAFLVPSNSEGVNFESLESIVGVTSKNIFLNDVYVMDSLRIGQPGDGWAVLQVAFETEHEADRLLVRRKMMVSKLIDYVKTKVKDKKSTFVYKQIRRKVIDSYIDNKVLGLLKIRNKWIRTVGKSITYESAQYAAMAREKHNKLADTVLDAIGPFSLITDSKWALMEGEAEKFQRETLAGMGPDGDLYTQEHLMGNRLGLKNNIRERP
jgi:alkylation response protein AidB-like acyl-CoA dehydrogenase